MTKEKIGRFVGPLIGICLFGLAVYVLNRELRDLDFAEIVNEFSAIPKRQVFWAIFWTAASYLLLTLYDVCAIRYVSGNLPYWKVALASFVGYTFSHNLGFSVLTGGAARYRLFSLWGLTPMQIAKAVAFSGLMYYLGFNLLGGIVILIDPPPAIKYLDFSPGAFRVIGVAMLLLLSLILILWLGKKKHPRVKGFDFPPASLRLTAACLVVAAVDWAFAASVNYSLLPETKLTFLQFLGIFQLSQIIGVASNIPGGLGVFEAIILMFMTKDVPATRMMGILLAYRVIYFLVPLALSTTLLFIHEILHKEGLAYSVARKLSLIK